MSVAVVGAGNFGTAIANIVAGNGSRTYLWMRDEKQLKDIRKHNENRRYLPGHSLHANIVPTSDLSEAFNDCNLVFVTVPSQSFREVAIEIGSCVRPGAYSVSATKRS